MATAATWKTEPEADGGWLSRRRMHTCALIFWLLSVVVFMQPLSGLASLSLHDERSSHILLVPLISGLLIYLQRKRVFRAPRFSPVIGISLLLMAGVLWYGLRIPISRSSLDRLPLAGSLIVVAWVAGFILFYGVRSATAAIFPLLFLTLMVPLPPAVVERTIAILQSGSAEASYALFRLLGIPVVRHGFLFALPGVDIEVAQQCSGINSAMSLFMTGLLAQHVFLEPAWSKLCFILWIFPIAIVKNAVRIVAISWLGIYVDPGFFHGALHRRGGLPFSVLALALMGVLLWLLRRVHTSRLRPVHPGD